VALQHRRFTTADISVDHFYLCHYRPKSSEGHDRLSQSLLRFKRGIEPDVRAWIECSVVELRQKFVNSGAAVMRALGHDETAAGERNSIGRLCERLLVEAGLHDARSALCKKRATSKLSMMPKRQRFEETFGNYFVDDVIPSNRLLIVDDILTSGATMTAIINAIRKRVPSISIKIFTFAFCDPLSEINESISLHGYNYSWQSIKGWGVNETEPLYKDTFQRLCQRIRQDDF
jgi:predicted amidophosphoribosyltransferase